MSTPDTGHAPAGPAAGGDRRRWRSAAAAVVAVAVLAGIGLGGWRLLHQSSSPTKPCPSPTASGPTVIAVRVLNGTTRRGLARRTAAALARRGFRIVGVGNGPRYAGKAQVRYAPPLSLPARRTALQIAGAALVLDATATTRVDIVLGKQFPGLRTPAQVAAATNAAKLPTPTPSPSSTCR